MIRIVRRLKWTVVFSMGCFLKFNPDSLGGEPVRIPIAHTASPSPQAANPPDSSVSPPPLQGIDPTQINGTKRSSNLELHLLKNSGDQPSRWILNLYDENDRRLPLELTSALSSRSELTPFNDSSDFSPSLPTGSFPAGSYFGIGLKIPFTKEEPPTTTPPEEEPESP